MRPQQEWSRLDRPTIIKAEDQDAKRAVAVVRQAIGDHCSKLEYLRQIKRLNNGGIPAHRNDEGVQLSQKSLSLKPTSERLVDGNRVQDLHHSANAHRRG